MFQGLRGTRACGELGERFPGMLIHEGRPGFELQGEHIAQHRLNLRHRPQQRIRLDALRTPFLLVLQPPHLRAQAGGDARPFGDAQDRQ